MKQNRLFKFKTTILALLAALLLAGCAMDSSLATDNGEALALEDDRAVDMQAVLTHLEARGFNTENHFFEDGHIVVEGDVGFELDALKEEMAKSDSRQYAHSYLVSQVRVTNIRVKTTANVTANWRAAVETAIADWNGIANCKIKFRLVGANDTADITISNNATTASYVARASFPNSEGKTGPTININPSYNGYLASTMRWVMVHEIGHCLGMRHINKYENGRVLIPGTPNADANSVMHPYVRTWTGFTAADINAAQYLYPQSGRYIVLYSENLYAGKRWIVQSGDNIADMGDYLLDNEISSIRCYGGAMVTLYTGTNYTGSKMLLPSSDSILSDNYFANNISSIKWNAPTGYFAVLYENSGFRGRQIVVGGNHSELRSLNFNNKISSVRLFNGLPYIVLCDYENYGGQRVTIRGSVYDLSYSSYNFDNRTSSIR